MLANLLGDDHPSTLTSLAHMERAHVVTNSRLEQSLIDKEVFVNRSLNPVKPNEVRTAVRVCMDSLC